MSEDSDRIQLQCEGCGVSRVENELYTWPTKTKTGQGFVLLCFPECIEEWQRNQKQGRVKYGQ